MPKIVRYEGANKNELGRIDFNTNSFILTQTHRSTRGVYNISIKDMFGNHVYTVKMDKEQINRIKQGEGISNIPFVDEEGFRSFIEYTYLGGREFNEEQFKKKFIDEFEENFNFLKDDFYKSAKVDNRIEYIQYLTSKLSPDELEELYYQNAPIFSVVWKYNPEGFGDEQIRNAKKIVGKLDSLISETQIFLNGRGREYVSRKDYGK